MKWLHLCVLHFFSYSFTVSDGSVETITGRVASPYSIMVHNGFRSEEARRARKQKYRSRQTASHSSLMVARLGDVSRKLNQAKIVTMNCRTLRSDVRVKVPWRPCCYSPSQSSYWMSLVLDARDRRFHIFCVYVSAAVDNHKAQCRTFYVELSSLVIDIPPRDHILICGDLNAPLTADGCRVNNVCGKPNRNSEALQAFFNLHDLIAASGIMRQKRIKLPTFDGPRGRYTRLDWIFGRNRFRQCVRKVMNIKTTVLTSDHRLLLVDYLLRWPSSKKRMASKIDWSYIALPSTRTDLVTSIRQFQGKGFDFVTARSSSAEISLPKSITPTRVRSWNNNV